jgi:hypothetical protein
MRMQNPGWTHSLKKRERRILCHAAGEECAPTAYVESVPCVVYR